MSDISQLAPRVALAAKYCDTFADWRDFYNHLLISGFTKEECEEIGNQLDIDWSKTQTCYSVLHAIDNWVKFHNEFVTVSKRSPLVNQRRDYRSRTTPKGSRNETARIASLRTPSRKTAPMKRKENESGQ